MPTLQKIILAVNVPVDILLLNTTVIHIPQKRWKYSVIKSMDNSFEFQYCSSLTNKSIKCNIKIY
jgi:hypothetical protein